MSDPTPPPAPTPPADAAPETAATPATAETVPDTASAPAVPGARDAADRAEDRPAAADGDPAERDWDDDDDADDDDFADPASRNGRVIYAPDPAVLARSGLLPWYDPRALAMPVPDTPPIAPPAAPRPAAGHPPAPSGFPGPLPPRPGNVDYPNEVRPLTPRQFRFAHAYLTEPNGTRAAITAGYSARSAQNQASRLMRNDEVLRKIGELRERLGLAYDVSRESLLDKLEAVYDFAVERGRFMPAVRAVMAQARIAGVFALRGPGDAAPILAGDSCEDALPRWPGLPAPATQAAWDDPATEKRSGGAAKKARTRPRARTLKRKKAAAPGSRARGRGGKSHDRRARRRSAAKRLKPSGRLPSVRP